MHHFPSNLKVAPFQLLIIFVLDGLRDDLSDIPREDILNLDASVVASRFCEWVQNEIDIFITHRNYQANPHSSISVVFCCLC